MPWAGEQPERPGGSDDPGTHPAEFNELHAGTVKIDAPVQKRGSSGRRSTISDARARESRAHRPGRV